MPEDVVGVDGHAGDGGEVGEGGAEVQGEEVSGAGGVQSFLDGQQRFLGFPEGFIMP